MTSQIVLSDATAAYPDYQPIIHQLAMAGIKLELTRKRVKNINFRLKPAILSVSAPLSLSDRQIAAALRKRLDWVIQQHPKLLAAHQQQAALADLKAKPKSVKLWGEDHAELMSESQRLALYRQALAEVMPALFAKWQPIVGQSAREQRIKKMSTRWGSCNVRARRIWLSVYLPAHPIECTEYVIVHELCHLHHANHSAKFWAEVRLAMPDYKHWHDRLAGKSSREQPLTID